MSEKKQGLTYRDAGVDIDAGNALVEAIKPLVRATRRSGADAESFPGMMRGVRRQKRRRADGAARLQSISAR